MYQRILVPLDGSSRAEAILPHVREMASRYDATILLLQVIEPVYEPAMAHSGIPSYNITESAMNALAEEARTYLDSWVAVLNNQEIQAETFVEFGSIVKNILWVAERENADLIAMSSHGRTGLPRVLYGSVAAGILHQTRLPLLLIRSEDAPET